MWEALSGELGGRGGMDSPHASPAILSVHSECSWMRFIMCWNLLIDPASAQELQRLVFLLQKQTITPRDCAFPSCWAQAASREQVSRTQPFPTAPPALPLSSGREVPEDALRMVCLGIPLE